MSPEIRCMQYAKCIKSNVRGSMAEKWLRNYFLDTAPISCYFLHFLTDLFNVILLYFFAGRNAAGCSKKYILFYISHPYFFATASSVMAAALLNIRF